MERSPGDAPYEDTGCKAGHVPLERELARFAEVEVSVKEDPSKARKEQECSPRPQCKGGRDAEHTGTMPRGCPVEVDV